MKCLNCKNEINFADTCPKCSVSQVHFIKNNLKDLSLSQLINYAINSQEHVVYQTFISLVPDLLVYYPKQSSFIKNAITEDLFYKILDLNSTSDANKLIKEELDNTFFDKDTYKEILEIFIGCVVSKYKFTDNIEQTKQEDNSPKKKKSLSEKFDEVASDISSTVSTGFEAISNRASEFMDYMKNKIKFNEVPEEEEDVESANGNVNLVLVELGPNRPKTIALLREVLSVDLVTASKIISNVPAIIGKDVEYNEAVKIRESFLEIGDKVKIFER